MDSGSSSPDPLGQPDLSSPSYLGSFLASSSSRRFWRGDRRGRSKSRSGSRRRRKSVGGRALAGAYLATAANTPSAAGGESNRLGPGDRGLELAIAGDSDSSTDENTTQVEQRTQAPGEEIEGPDFADSDSLDEGGAGFELVVPQELVDSPPSAQRGRRGVHSHLSPQKRHDQPEEAQVAEEEQEEDQLGALDEREQDEQDYQSDATAMDRYRAQSDSSPEQARPVTHMRPAAASAATTTTVVPLKTGEETPKRRKKRRTLTPRRRRTTPVASRLVEHVYEPDDVQQGNDLMDAALTGENEQQEGEEEDLVAAQLSPTPRKKHGRDHPKGYGSLMTNATNGSVKYPDIGPQLQVVERLVAPGASPGKRRRIVSDGESSDSGVFVRPAVSMSERLGAQSAIVSSMSPVKESAVKAQQQQRAEMNEAHSGEQVGGAAVGVRTLDPTDEHEEFDSILESEDFTMVSLSSIPSGQQLRSLTRGGRPVPPGPPPASLRQSPRTARTTRQASMQSTTPAAPPPPASVPAAVPTKAPLPASPQANSQTRPPATPYGNGLLSGFSPATRRELRAGLRLGQELAKRTVEAKRILAQSPPLTQSQPQPEDPPEAEDSLADEVEPPIDDATTDIFADLAAAESSHVSTSSIGDRIRKAGEFIQPHARPQAASTAAAASRTPPRARAHQLPSPEQSDEHDTGQEAGDAGGNEMSWRYDTPAKSRLGLQVSAARGRGSVQRGVRHGSPMQREEQPVTHVPYQNQQEDEGEEEEVEEEVEEKETEEEDESEEVVEEVIENQVQETADARQDEQEAEEDYEYDEDDGFDAPSSPDKQLFLEQAAAELEASRLTQATANGTAEDAVEISSNEAADDSSSSDEEAPPELSDATKSFLADATYDIWQTEAEEASALSKSARSRVDNSSSVLNNAPDAVHDEHVYRERMNAPEDQQEAESEPEDDAVEPGFVIHEDEDVREGIEAASQVSDELEEPGDDRRPGRHIDHQDDAAVDYNDQSNEHSYDAEDEPVEVKDEPVPASEREDVEVQDVEMQDVGDIQDDLDFENGEDEADEVDEAEEEAEEEDEEDDLSSEIEDEPSADTQLLRRQRSQQSGETPSSPAAAHHQPSSPPRPPHSPPNHHSPPAAAAAPAQLSQPLNPPKSHLSSQPAPSLEHKHPVEQDLFPPRRSKLPSLWRRQSSDPVVYSDEPELPPAEDASAFRNVLGKRQRTWVTPEARKKSRFDDADFSVLSEFDHGGSGGGGGGGSHSQGQRRGRGSTAPVIGGRSAAVVGTGPPSSPLKRVRFESEDPENPYLPTTPVVRMVQRIVEEEEDEEEEEEEEEEISQETSQEVSASFEEEEELSHDMDGEPVRIMWEAKPSPEQRQQQQQRQRQQQRAAVTNPAPKQGSWLSGLLPSWFKAPKEPVFRFALPNLPQLRRSATMAVEGEEEEEEEEEEPEQEQQREAVPRTPSSAAHSSSSPPSSRRSRRTDPLLSSPSQSHSHSHPQQQQHSSPSPFPSHRHRQPQQTHHNHHPASYLPPAPAAVAASPPPSPRPPTTIPPRSPQNPNAYKPAPPPASFSAAHYTELKRLYMQAKERPFPIPRADRAVMALLGWEISRLGWRKRVNSWELGVVAAFLESDVARGLVGEDGERDEGGRAVCTPEQVARRLFSIWAVEVQRGETGLGRATAGKFSTAYVARREEVLARARRRKSMAAS